MTRLGPDLPTRLGDRRHTAAFGAAVVALLWAGIAVSYLDGLRAREREAARTSHNTAMVFEESVLHSIGEIDKALLYLRRAVEARRSTADDHTIVATTDVLSDIIVQVGIIDADGVMRASSTGPQPTPAIDRSDRRHYRVHLDGGADRLFISKPRPGYASDRWSIQLSRRFLNQDGSFAGVVVASLDPEKLTRVYDQLDLGLAASVALIGSDGLVRSSGGRADWLRLGADIRGSGLDGVIAVETDAAFETVGPEGGETRMVTVRKVRGHPLWVAVGTDKAGIHRASLAMLQLHVASGIMLTIFVVAGVKHILDSEARVARLAAEDPLTALPNRRTFHAALCDIGRVAPAEDATGPRYAVMIVDVDRFKAINDTLGHQVGDGILREVAKRLRKALRPTDLAARLGGDEFAILATPVDSRRAVEEYAARLVEVLAEPYIVDGRRISCSASIGVALAPENAVDPADLLRSADVALYAVKINGPGGCKLFRHEMVDALDARRHLETDLREAIERDRLELHYQPIVDLRRDTVMGFEALARWDRPGVGPVPPSVFIPVAEDSGLVLPLGEWALVEACRRASRWPGDIKVAVNISPIQFTARDLVAIVESALAAAGLAPHRLEIEITERVLLADSERTLRTLHRLKRLGVCIAMDDFGTGYSSLSYLRSFPFDKIKIDRTFVVDLKDGIEKIAIVQAVISMAHALGMKTTAEGVETIDQQRYLSALGCDEAQGFLFGRPLPIEDVAGLLSGWGTRRDRVA
jgi:diguanylate cyclase (GGDEF)-like protein